MDASQKNKESAIVLQEQDLELLLYCVRYTQGTLENTGRRKEFLENCREEYNISDELREDDLLSHLEDLARKLF